MPRKSTGKRVRFDVFKRDAFTCQYCGAQPPAVVLVIDHIRPVADGGDNAPENLLTACEACNQGKAARPMGERIVRPDADLMWLETQQEIVELRRYQEAIAEKDAAIRSVVSALQKLWIDTSGLDRMPSDFVMRQLIAAYPVWAVWPAVENTARKVSSGYIHGGADGWVRYMHGIAKAEMADLDG